MTTQERRIHLNSIMEQIVHVECRWNKEMQRKTKRPGEIELLREKLYELNYHYVMKSVEQ